VRFQVRQQTGMTLLITLAFLVLVTLVSILAANNSSIGLRMSANMQHAYQSFQAAETGAVAVLALSGTVADPFDGSSGTKDPFAYFNHSPAAHPLHNITAGRSAISVSMTLNATAGSCPRLQSGFSVNIFKCEHYDIESKHAEKRKAQTEIHLGVIKTLIGNTH